MDLNGILKNFNFAQVAMVVNDIDEVSKQYGKLFGCAPAEANWCGEFAVMQTKVFGELAPEANSKLAFFQLTPNVSLELIEPNKASSVWRDALNKYGEGLHHIAFNVDGADEVAKQLCEEFGGKIEQQGTYGDGSGQYIYVDLFDKLKVRIELLETFKN